MRKLAVYLTAFGLLALILPVFGLQSKLILLGGLALGNAAWAIPLGLIGVGVCLLVISFISEGAPAGLGGSMEAKILARRRLNIEQRLARGIPSRDEILGAGESRLTPTATDRLYPYARQIITDLAAGELEAKTAAKYSAMAGVSTLDVYMFDGALNMLDLKARRKAEAASAQDTGAPPPVED